MSSQIVPPFGSATIAVAASALVATFSEGGDQYEVNQVVGYPNQPTQLSNLFRGSGANATSAFSAAGTVVVNAGAYPVLVNIGVAGTVFERSNYQGTPGVLNATGALTAAMMLAGIVTSTTAAAVAATVPTGTVLDAAATLAISPTVGARSANFRRLIGSLLHLVP
jgi:hypothetical protein